MGLRQAGRGGVEGSGSGTKPSKNSPGVSNLNPESNVIRRGIGCV